MCVKLGRRRDAKNAYGARSTSEQLVYACVMLMRVRFHGDAYMCHQSRDGHGIGLPVAVLHKTHTAHVAHLSSSYTQV